MSPLNFNRAFTTSVSPFSHARWSVPLFLSAREHIGWLLNNSLSTLLVLQGSSLINLCILLARFLAIPSWWNVLWLMLDAKNDLVGAIWTWFSSKFIMRLLYNEEGQWVVYVLLTEEVRYRGALYRVRRALKNGKQKASIIYPTCTSINAFDWQGYS